MSSAAIDNRLLSAAKFVRAGAVFADIGTDHGYLPIFLFSKGKIERAVLSDINEGPLASARENLARAGLADSATLMLTDGAAALGGLGITDYAICGMGGELIADIIASAPQLFDTGVRLILQPMSKQAHLRSYLCASGFDIIGESYSHADGKYYLCICAEYTGKKHQINAVEAELGTKEPSWCDTAAYVGYLEVKLSGLRRAEAGKRKGGDAAPKEAELCRAIEKKLSILRANER